MSLPALVARAGPDGDDFALLGLLGGRIGDDDATGRLGFAVDALDDHAVVQGTEFHGKWSSSLRRSGVGVLATWHFAEGSAKAPG